MVARAAAGHPGAEGPSILRLVPLLRVSGQKGQRVVLVGHSCLSIHDVDHVAVESSATNAWVEGPAEGEFERMDVAAAGVHEQVGAATEELSVSCRTGRRQRRPKTCSCVSPSMPKRWSNCPQRGGKHPGNPVRPGTPAGALQQQRPPDHQQYADSRVPA